MADIYAANWHADDNANTAAAPDGLPEGAMPSGVNNWARATMGAVKRYVNQQSPVTTTGSASAFIASATVPPGALYDGSTHTVEFHATNGVGATLNIGATGAVPLHYYAAGAWRLIPAGLIGANQVQRVAYNTAAGAYRLLDLQARTGEVVAFAGATAPAGALLCYGQAISRTAYAGLFAALGDAHGVGDGSSTFNLPDLRGRAAAGKSDMGGSNAGNLSGGATLGAGLGAETHTLLLTEMPAHAHDVGSNSFLYQPGTGGPVYSVATYPGGSAWVTSSNGSGAAHNNVQPTRVLNYVIRI